MKTFSFTRIPASDLSSQSQSTMATSYTIIIISLAIVSQSDHTTDVTKQLNSVFER